MLPRSSSTMVIHPWQKTHLRKSELVHLKKHVNRRSPALRISDHRRKGNRDSPDGLELGNPDEAVVGPLLCQSSDLSQN